MSLLRLQSVWQPASAHWHVVVLSSSDWLVGLCGGVDRFVVMTKRAASFYSGTSFKKRQSKSSCPISLLDMKDGFGCCGGLLAPPFFVNFMSAQRCGMLWWALEHVKNEIEIYHKKGHEEGKLKNARSHDKCDHVAPRCELKIWIFSQLPSKSA